MNASDTPIQALKQWIAAARTGSPRLDNEADSCLGRLARLSGQSLNRLRQTPLTLGLYGHSPEGKHHLLSALAAEASGEISVRLGNATVNYLRQINPGVSPSVAVRFTRTAPPQADGYPLLLDLCSESDLALTFMRRYHARPDARMITASDMTARISALQTYRLAHPSPGMTRYQFAMIAQAWQTLLRHDDYPDDGLLYRMAEIAEWLSISDRASLLALLWGDDPALTQTWETLAHTLAQMGYADRLLAPASLLMDSALRPAEGFLIPSRSDAPAREEDILVRPLREGCAQSSITIQRQRLASLCHCVNLTLSGQTPAGHIDIIDIPVDGLESLGQHLQPDTLLLCHAIGAPHEMAQTATMLSDWLERTQGESESALPRLVWAVTPFDPRFSDKGHLDDGLQHLLNRAGKSWGILQAMDKHNLFRLREWVAEAMNPQAREQRISALTSARQKRLRDDVVNMLTAEIATPKQVEELVRGLQSQAAHFGAFSAHLTLSRSAIQQCWLQFAQTTAHSSTHHLELDLFAGSGLSAPLKRPHPSFASLIFQRWVNHVRQLSLRPQVARQLAMPVERLRGLSDVLIATAYHTGLGRQLDEALQPYDDNGALAQACAGNVLSDFISWLGYQHVSPDQRPESKVNLGQAVFEPASQADASQRLTTLGQEQYMAHIRYIYDWLVALYHRGLERTAHLSGDLSEAERRALEEIAHALGVPSAAAPGAC